MGGGAQALGFGGGGSHWKPLEQPPGKRGSRVGGGGGGGEEGLVTYQGSHRVPGVCPGPGPQHQCLCCHGSPARWGCRAGKVTGGTWGSECEVEALGPGWTTTSVTVGICLLLGGCLSTHTSKAHSRCSVNVCQ